MFELIGMLVVAWVSWKVFKIFFGGNTKNTLDRAVQYAVKQGVPIADALDFVNQPEVIKKMRKDLAAANQGFAAQAVYEQYGGAIAALYFLRDMDRVKNEVKNIIAPQLAVLGDSALDSPALTVSPIIFAYIQALIMSSTAMPVTPQITKEVIEILFDNEVYANAIEMAWTLVLHSAAGYAKNIAAFIPLAEREVAAAKGDYLVRYINKSVNEKPDPHMDPREIPDDWFLNV